MTSPRKLDLKLWSRREHFEYFRSFEEPFFNVCVDLDVTKLIARCQADRKLSFFACTLYLSLKAANEVESFRYRIRGHDVIVYEVIHGGSAILRDDETFGLGFFEFTPNFAQFAPQVRRVIDAVKQGPPGLRRASERDDMMRYSVLPWITFTSFSHAHASREGDSIPRLVFGKYRLVGDSFQMPLSVEVHHALVDGIHVGDFLQRFQQHLLSLPVESGDVK